MALAWQIDETDKDRFSERIFVGAPHKGVMAGVKPLTETAAAAVPDPPRALPQNATDNDLKWQPVAAASARGTPASPDLR
ncbi:hypothetical protein ACSHXN_47205 (plasmid) [Streptomyces sp. HUAS TT11]|uniref:hypothetical protein n=1 Tax=Streptomyces sp. HUAS TT11 TaxID=3447508 RepID=UPI003F659826